MANRSSPQVHSRTRVPDQTALPPCEECEDCRCCCEQQSSYLTTNFLGAQMVRMNRLWSEFEYGSGQAFSIAFWMKWSDAVHAPPAPKSTIVARTGFDPGDPNLTGYVVFVTDAGRVRINIYSDEYGDNTDPNAYIQVEETGTDVLTSGWRHIVVTYDGSGLTSGVNIYIDGAAGTLSATGNGVTGKNIIPPATSSTKFQMGLIYDVTGNQQDYAKLYVAEFAMFNTKLSDEDVQYLSGRMFDAVKGCDSPMNVDTSVTPFETCPGGGQLWYRMGDDIADSLAAMGQMTDQLPNNRHGATSGFTESVFTADSPLICDCHGFGTGHVWQYDPPERSHVFMPATMSVETTDASNWPASSVTDDRATQRFQLLNLDRAFSTPGYADQAPTEWWGAITHDDVFAGRNYAAAQFTPTGNKVIFVSFAPSGTATARALGASDKSNTAASAPAVPSPAVSSGFAMTGAPHPTTGNPGIILSVLSGGPITGKQTFWYDPAGDAWTAGPNTAAPKPAGSTVAGSAAIGKVYFGISATSDIEVYDVATSAFVTSLTVPSGRIFAVGSSMAVHPTTGDLYMLVYNDQASAWEYMHYAVSSATWTTLATPPDPFLAAGQPMHIIFKRGGTASDFMVLIASNLNSNWEVWQATTNTWGQYRAPVNPINEANTRWFKTSHIATIVPRS